MNNSGSQWLLGSHFLRAPKKWTQFLKNNSSELNRMGILKMSYLDNFGLCERKQKTGRFSSVLKILIHLV